MALSSYCSSPLVEDVEELENRDRELAGGGGTMRTRLDPEQ